MPLNREGARCLPGSCTFAGRRSANEAVPRRMELRMSRKSPLDDVEVRAKLLILIRRGEQFDKAANQVGTSRRAITRHGEKWPAFAVEVAAATAEGDARRSGLPIGVEIPQTEVGPHLNPPLVAEVTELLDPHEALAERLRLDVRAIAAVDAAMPKVIIPLADWLSKAERMIDDPKVPVALRVAAWKTVDDWRKAHLSVAYQRLANQPRRDPIEVEGTSSRRAPARARGLTQETKQGVLRAIIGPPPRKSATPA